MELKNSQPIEHDPPVARLSLPSVALSSIFLDLSVSGNKMDMNTKESQVVLVGLSLVLTMVGEVVTLEDYLTYAI